MSVELPLVGNVDGDVQAGTVKLPPTIVNDAATSFALDGVNDPVASVDTVEALMAFIVLSVASSGLFADVNAITTMSKLDMLVHVVHVQTTFVSEEPVFSTNPERTCFVAPEVFAPAPLLLQVFPPESVNEIVPVLPDE